MNTNSPLHHSLSEKKKKQYKDFHIFSSLPIKALSLSRNATGKMEKIDDTEISKLPHITLIASDVKAQSSGKYVKQSYVQGAGLCFFLLDFFVYFHIQKRFNYNSLVISS